MCFLAQARRVPTLVPEHARAPYWPGPSPSVLTAPGGRPAVGEDGARGDHIPSPGGDERTSLRSGQQRAAWETAQLKGKGRYIPSKTVSFCWNELYDQMTTSSCTRFQVSSIASPGKAGVGASDRCGSPFLPLSARRGAGCCPYHATRSLCRGPGPGCLSPQRSKAPPPSGCTCERVRFQGGCVLRVPVLSGPA